MLNETGGILPDGMNYESKIVRFYNRDKGFAYSYLLTRIDNRSEEHNILDQEGYRSDHMIITLLSGGSVNSGTDPYNPPMRSDLTRAFLTEIRDGDIGWEQLEDDTVYTWEDYEELKNAEEQDSEKP